jgi:membrane protein implicated in regulation of membrane protease activity
VLHTSLMVVLGLVLIGILSADFEILGITNPYWSRSVAAACVIATAFAHSWTWLVSGIVLMTLYLMVRRDWRRRVERRGKSSE